MRLPLNRSRKLYKPINSNHYSWISSVIELVGLWTFWIAILTVLTTKLLSQIKSQFTSHVHVGQTENMAGFDEISSGQLSQSGQKSGQDWEISGQRWEKDGKWAAPGTIIQFGNKNWVAPGLSAPWFGAEFRLPRKSCRAPWIPGQIFVSQIFVCQFWGKTNKQNLT